MTLEYSKTIDELHDKTSNSVIDLYLKRESASTEDEKLVYSAMIDFYFKLKQAMDITRTAILKATEDVKKLSVQEKL